MLAPTSFLFSVASNGTIKYVTFENKLGLKSYILNVDIKKEFSVEFRLNAFPGRLLQLVYILV